MGMGGEPCLGSLNNTSSLLDHGQLGVLCEHVFGDISKSALRHLAKAQATASASMGQKAAELYRCHILRARGDID